MKRSGITLGLCVAAWAEALADAEQATQPNKKPSPDLARTIETLNHNPIEFYGRAIDQFGDPVAGAEVRATVLVYTGTRGGEMKVQTTTDAAGYFQFSTLRGQGLGMGFEKPGYEFRSSTSYFSFSYFEADHKRHAPDDKNPVVFTLWKLQGPEQIIHYHKTIWEIPADGTQVRIDLYITSESFAQAVEGRAPARPIFPAHKGLAGARPSNNSG